MLAKAEGLYSVQVNRLTYFLSLISNQRGFLLLINRVFCSNMYNFEIKSSVSVITKGYIQVMMKYGSFYLMLKHTSSFCKKSSENVPENLPIPLPVLGKCCKKFQIKNELVSTCHLNILTSCFCSVSSRLMKNSCIMDTFGIILKTLV